MTLKANVCKSQVLSQIVETHTYTVGLCLISGYTYKVILKLNGGGNVRNMVNTELVALRVS